MHSMFLSCLLFTAPVGTHCGVWSVAKLPGPLRHPGHLFPPLSLSLCHTIAHYMQSSRSHAFTHTHTFFVSHAHTQNETPSLPSLHGANQKVSWLRAGIRQSHRGDRAKTTAALTFCVLIGHPSDNFVSQRKLS